MARAASPSSGKPKREPAKKPAAKPAASNAEGEDSSELRSLQHAFEKGRRFKAVEAQLLNFSEQMLLIRRFEEKAGQL